MSRDSRLSWKPISAAQSFPRCCTVDQNLRPSMSIRLFKSFAVSEGNLGRASAGAAGLN